MLWQGIVVYVWEDIVRGWLFHLLDEPVAVGMEQLA